MIAGGVSRRVFRGATDIRNGALQFSDGCISLAIRLIQSCARPIPLINQFPARAIAAGAIIGLRPRTFRIRNLFLRRGEPACGFIQRAHMTCEIGEFLLGAVDSVQRRLARGFGVALPLHQRFNFAMQRCDLFGFVKKLHVKGRGTRRKFRDLRGLLLHQVLRCFKLLKFRCARRLLLVGG